MSDAYRQSALLLHGVSEADRSWVLAQLAAEQREPHAQHLGELKSLGMPADRTLTERLLTQPGVSAVGKEEKADRNPTLANVHEDVMHILLGQEPIWLIATVLSIEAWLWRDGFVAKFDVSRRARIQSAMRDCVPNKLAQALVSRLEDGLPEAMIEVAGRPVAQPPVVSFGRKIQQMAKKWF